MTPRERTLETIRLIGERYGVGLPELLGPSRLRPIAWARFHAYAELYSRGMTSSEIARVFNREHSTIRHGIKRAAEFQYNMFPRWACHRRGKRAPRLSPLYSGKNVLIGDGCYPLETAQ